MSTFKRFFALLLTLSMVFSLVPMSVFAEEIGEDGQVIEGTTAPVEETTTPVDGNAGLETAAVDDGIMTTADSSSAPGGTNDAGQPFPTSFLNGGHYRIPGMVTLDDGTIVAAADARWHAWDYTDDNGDIDTIVSYSIDNGANWTYQLAVYDGTDNAAGASGYTNYNAATIIDPALATDGTNLYMLVDLFPGQAGQANSSGQAQAGTGLDDNGNLKLRNGVSATSYDYYLSGGRIYDYATNTDQGYAVDGDFNVTKDGQSYGNLFVYNNASGFHPLMTSYLCLVKSTDGGKTWSDPVILNNQVKNASETFYGVGPGRGLVTSDGTIMFACYTYPTQYASVIYSTNGGATWNRTGNITSSIWSSETQLVELFDGTIRAFFRNGQGKICYVDGTGSPETGYTWGNYVATGITNQSNCMISAISYSRTYQGQQVILVSCPTSSSSRSNGKIFTFVVGENNSLNKINEYTVDSGAFSYSCMTELKDGSIGMLYEKGDSGNITYVSWPAETLTGLTFDEPVNTVADGSVSVEVVASSGVTHMHAENTTVTGITTDYVAYDITLCTDAEANCTAGVNCQQKYTGAATVSIPLTDAMIAAGEDKLKGFVVNTDGTISSIYDVTLEDGILTFDAPHFSVVGAAVIAANDVVITDTVNVTIKEGQTSQTYTDTTGNYENAATNVAPNSTYATMNITGSDDGKIMTEVTEATFEAGKTYIIVSERSATEGLLTNSEYTATISWSGLQISGLNTHGTVSADTEHLWTITPTGDGKYYIMYGDQYLTLDHANTSTAALVDTATALNLTHNGTYWYITNADGDYLSNVGGFGNGYYGASGFNEAGGSGWKIHEITGGYTEVSFTGVSAGSTTAIVGSTQYNITVDELSETVEITLTIGEELTVTIDDYAYTSDNVTVQPNENKATLDAVIPGQKILAGNLEAVTTNTIPDGQYLLVNNRAGGMLTTATTTYGSQPGFVVDGTAAFNSTELWTITKTTNGYTISRDGQYLYLGNRTVGLSANAAVLTIEKVDAGWLISDGTNYLSDIFGGSWNGASGYEARNDDGNYWTIYKIVPTDTEDYTEVTFTGVAPGNTTATVGHVTYNITVYGNRDITINYVCDGVVVATETRTVATNTIDVDLPQLVSDGTDAYTTNSPKLKLTSATTYSVPVTKLDVLFVDKENTPFVGNTGAQGLNQPIAGLIITSHSSYDLNLKISGTDISWAIDDPAVATVDENGTVSGVAAGETIITATVDGITYAIPLTVLPGDNSTNNRVTDVYNTEVTNCTAYYSFNNGELVEFPEGTQLYIENDMSATAAICFYGVPNDGYALTYMNGTGGTYFHSVRSNDGKTYGTDYSSVADIPTSTGRDGWAFDCMIGSIVKNAGAATVEDIQRLINTSLEMGVDGIFFFSRASGVGNIGTQTTFVAEKLPEVEKTLNGVLPTTRLMADFRRYEGTELVAAVEEYVYFNVTVTLEAPHEFRTENGERYSLLEFDAAVITEGLEGAYFYTKELDEADNNYPDCGTPGVLMDGVIDYEPNRLESNDIAAALNAPWTDEEIANGQRVIELYVVYPIAADYIDETIVNTVDLDYTYTSAYSRGTRDAIGHAEADIRVVGKYMDTVIVDFGLPIVIDDSNDEYGFHHAVRAECDYGEVTLNGDILTYTPNTVLQGTDTVVLYDSNGDSVNSFIVMPASTVYYEEGFAEFTGTWTSTGSTGTGTQELQFVGTTANNFGYDGTYAAQTGMSNGTEAVSSATGSKASFTFTGNGVDIYANCDTDTGIVAVVLYQVNADNSLTVKKVYQVATATKDGTTDATSGQAGSAYALPIVAISNLPHGTYKVEMLVTGVQGAFHLDGFRVYNTITAQNSYPADEQYPTFIELRDEALFSAGVTGTTTVDQVYSLSGSLSGVSLLYLTDGTESDLLENGPKNEIWLSGNDTLSFNLPLDAQIGLKAPNGSVTVEVYSGTTLVATYTITSATDMFYDLPTGVVTLKVTGGNILSVTKLKAVAGGAAPLGEITEEVVVYALKAMYNVDDEISTFADVNANSFYYEPVMWAVENGITTGTTATTFAPLANCNRAQVVTFLWRAAGCPEPNSIKTPFVDVSSDAFYYKAVLWAVETGITNGVDATHFAPNAECNRAQVVTFLWRAEGSPAPAASVNPFVDVAESAFYYDAVLWASENDIANGVAASEFSPNANCNRAQIVTFLYRAMA